MVTCVGVVARYWRNPCLLVRVCRLLAAHVGLNTFAPALKCVCDKATSTKSPCGTLLKSGGFKNTEKWKKADVSWRVHRETVPEGRMKYFCYYCRVDQVNMCTSWSFYSCWWSLRCSSNTHERECCVPVPCAVTSLGLLTAEHTRAK